MFTGIIETLGTITEIKQQGTNLQFTIQSDLSDELRIDQSLSHDGVCLTVVDRPAPGHHTVTAVAETLRRSNLGQWAVGSCVNLERALAYGGRLDGHLVQGHVDAVATLATLSAQDGSWEYMFEYPSEYRHLLVDKGSVCINGVSLTVVRPGERYFSVAIIPYTYEHTNFQRLSIGQLVNIEFDIIGKYIARQAQAYLSA